MKVTLYIPLIFCTLIAFTIHSQDKPKTFVKPDSLGGEFISTINIGGALLTTIEAGAIIATNKILDPVTLGLTVGLYGLEALNEAACAEAKNTKSVIIPLMLTGTNATNCFLRYFLATVQISDPTLDICDYTHATRALTSTAYYAYLATKNFTNWFNSNSTTALTAKAPSLNEQDEESDDE